MTLTDLCWALFIKHAVFGLCDFRNYDSSTLKVSQHVADDCLGNYATSLAKVFFKDNINNRFDYVSRESLLSKENSTRVLQKLVDKLVQKQGHNIQDNKGCFFMPLRLVLPLKPFFTLLKACTTFSRSHGEESCRNLLHNRISYKT